MKLFLPLIPLLFIACANNYPINKIPPKNTFVKKEKKEANNSSQEFRKDDHRYDPRYRNFNYDRLGYSNNMGDYYGYYDHDGYFCNNIYYNYNDYYDYNDRVARRGAFAIDARHHRDIIDNRWNQTHNPYQPNYTRVYHPREGVIEYGDVSYQNSHENVKNRIDSRRY